VMEVADRIIVLRLGRRVATFDRKTTTGDEVVAAITGASVKP
jgi:D-xylose transport system ATP-binding protein